MIELEDQQEEGYTPPVDEIARAFGVPGDILKALKLVGRANVEELEKMGGDPTQFTALSGVRYRLTSPYQWNDYQAEAVQKIVMDVLGPIKPGNDAIGNEPIEVTPTKIRFDAEAFLSLLIGNEQVHRFFAHLYLPESETVFNPATAQDRIEDMRCLTYGQKMGAIYRFFTSGIAWVTAVIRAYFLPLVAEMAGALGMLDGVSVPKPFRKS